VSFNYTKLTDKPIERMRKRIMYLNYSDETNGSSTTVVEPRTGGPYPARFPQMTLSPSWTHVFLNVN
jgi:hypothetical protein